MMTHRYRGVYSARRMNNAPRFEFGKNWQDFLSTVTAESVDRAERGLSRLFPSIENLSFLDIGCGSGLSLLAAHRLGAMPSAGVDIDPASVAAARQLLSGSGIAVEERNVFDLDPKEMQFDIVYSWGVLHHTGDMWGAIKHSTALVKPGGHLAIAIYRKTPLCWFWKIEKRLYTAAPAVLQKIMRGTFKAAFLVGVAMTGRNPVAYVRDYKSERGMSWTHDVHDWLGGYPYESADPSEIENCLGRNGCVIVYRNERRVRLAGLLGSPCNEYVARRQVLGFDP